MHQFGESDLAERMTYLLKRISSGASIETTRTNGRVVKGSSCPLVRKSTVTKSACQCRVTCFNMEAGDEKTSGRGLVPWKSESGAGDGRADVGGDVICRKDNLLSSKRKLSTKE